MGDDQRQHGFDVLVKAHRIVVALQQSMEKGERGDLQIRVQGFRRGLLLFAFDGWLDRRRFLVLVGCRQRVERIRDDDIEMVGENIALNVNEIDQNVQAALAVLRILVFHDLAQRANDQWHVFGQR